MTSLRIPDARQRSDLAVFVRRVIRLDPAAVIRLRKRADGLIGAWAATGFDVLVTKAVAGTLQPGDVTCGADQLGRSLGESAPDGGVDTGYPMDSAWRAALPPEAGFVHLDDVPVAAFAALAREGADLAREHAGPQGPPPSLLDQEVLTVSAGGELVGVPMRCVMALAAMGFIPDDADDVVRVRVMPTWLRIDARFGSVFRRRGGPALLLG